MAEEDNAKVERRVRDSFAGQGLMQTLGALLTATLMVIEGKDDIRDDLAD